MSNQLPSYEELTKNKKEDETLPSYDDLMASAAKPPASENNESPVMNTLSNIQRAKQHIALSGLQGVTGNFLDEIVAGAGALGERGLEEVGLKKNTGRSLSDLYNEYKKSVRDEFAKKEEGSGLLESGAANIAQLGGSLIGPGKVVGAAAKAGKLATLGSAAVTGALEAAGKSEAEAPSELAKETAAGAGAGLIGGAGGELASKGIGYLAGRAVESPLAKQFAATVLNKAKGGTLFTDTGKEAVEQQSRGLIKDITDEITSPLSAKNAEFGKAFKTAKEQGQTLVPDIAEQKIVSDFKTILGDDAEALFGDYLEKLNKGTLNPDEANQLRRAIKDLVANLKSGKSSDAIDAARQFKLGQKLEGTGIVNSLEEMSSRAGTDIGKLNLEKQKAYEALEQIVPGIREGRASSLTDEQIRDKTGTYLSELLEKSGLGTTRGTEGAVDIKELYNKLGKLRKAGQLDVNEEEIARKLQNQATLEAARKKVSGYTEQADETVNRIIDKLKPKKLSIYGVAEGLAGNKGIQDVSKFLLEANNERLLGVANRLIGDPAYAHLGKSLAEAVETNARPKINAAIFTMMQNPATRSLIQRMLPEM